MAKLNNLFACVSRKSHLLTGYSKEDRIMTFSSVFGAHAKTKNVSQVTSKKYEILGCLDLWSGESGKHSNDDVLFGVPLHFLLLEFRRQSHKMMV